MEYEKDLIVEQYQCDLHDCLSPGWILRHVQQISTDHCDACGLTLDRFKATNTAFLLAKLAIEFVRPIPLHTHLHLLTQPSVPVRAIYHRFTTLSDEAQEEFCSVDARWVLIDTEKRHILRNPPEGLDFPFLPKPPRTHDVSIARADSLTSAGSYTATYSRSDHNGHLNNTFYADLICDALPLSLVSQRHLRRMVISYHQELLLGESMEILWGNTAPDTYYLCGMKDERRYFEASVTFA